MPARPSLAALTIAAAILLAACSPSPDSPLSEPAAPSSTTSPTTSVLEPQPTAVATGTPWTVSGPVSGNRVLEASGDLRSQIPVDVPLPGVPVWVVGVPSGEGSVWVVALEDGQLQGWSLADGQPVAVELNITSLPPGAPPVVVPTSEGVSVIGPPEDASPLTYPIPIGDGAVAYVTEAGELVVQSDSQSQRFDIAVLPDSRITRSEDGLLAVLGDSTTRYPHGVLGDNLEAASLLVVDPGSGEIVAEAAIPAPAVIEGVAAIWADVDGIPGQEILVTVSDADVGARLVVFNRDGTEVASGPAIGRGNRWRNQLGAGPFGPNGEIEVVDVRVPHIGGVVEFFRLDGSELAFETQVQGHTSHMFGSRNLDLALGTDVTGDGLIDVVVPTQQLTDLSVISRQADGADVVAQLALPGTLTTNLAATETEDGRLVLAAGTSDGVLRIWISE